MYPIFCFPLLSLLNNFILLFIYLSYYYLKKTNIFENYKNYKYRKKIKKKVLLLFIVFVQSLALCDTYFLKILKIFSFLLIYVRPFASCDTIFSNNLKNTKKYKNFKNTKYQFFQTSKLYKNYVIFDSPLWDVRPVEFN